MSRKNGKSKLEIKSSINASPGYDPPLDYTFMCLTTISDCLEEEPRERKNPLKPTTTEAGESPDKGKKKTNAIRLSNNVIPNWEEFSITMDRLIEDPEDLEWIDLSFNDLTGIDECVLQFKNLKVLYLHGNSIEKLSEVDKLASLSCLRSLTLHGNPIEDNRNGYRQYVLSKLPLLKTFDFSGVTKSDRACSEGWKQMHKGKRKKKQT